MKILIAEDDGTFRSILQDLFSRWGHEPIAVDNGSKAMEILEGDDPPQMVVMCSTLKEVEGTEICRRQRLMTDRSYTYFISLTAKGSREDILNGFDAGVNDYVVKPFDIDELQARIKVGGEMVSLHNSLAKRVSELQEALDQINNLHGIITICVHCHSIFNDQQSWQKLESYVEAHSAAQFSHGLCPICLDKYYPDEDDDDKDADGSETATEQSA
jgi:phosphoserine phosphatase RsbU/P